MTDELPTKPFLILVKFDKQDGLAERIKTIGSGFVEAIKELGSTAQFVTSSYDGSMVAFLVTCALTADQVHERLQSPKSRMGSVLDIRDIVMVVSIESGVIPRLSRIGDWLDRHASTSARLTRR